MIREITMLEKPEETVAELIQFIRESVRKRGAKGVIVGNSGGVDSAAVIFLAVKALGKNHVRTLYMPERDTAKETARDAMLVAKAAGVKMKTVPITSLVRKLGVYASENPALFVPQKIQARYVLHRREAYHDENGTPFYQSLIGGAGKPELQNDVAYYSVKNRLRMTTLYLYGERYNLLVLGTSNRSEKMAGLYIKYGDGACDAAPIAGLYKTQVWQIAKVLGVPRRIITKPPTSDLAPGLTDAQTLTMGYDKFDIILAGIDMQESEASKAEAAEIIDDESIMAEAGCTAEDLEYVRSLIRVSEHMRCMPWEPEVGK
jgi:NAD synthase